MKKLFQFVMVVCVLFVSVNVMAMDVNQLRNQGFAGEGVDGLLQPMNTAPAHVLTYINGINEQRLLHYKESAANAGVSMEVFQVRMAERIVNSLPKGVWYQNTSGNWVKK